MRILVAFLIVLTSTSFVVTADGPVDADLLLAGGTIHDGSGADGAWGMATGLIYVPGTYSKTEELIELARVVAEHGGIYASHIRGEGRELLTSVEEALTIGREMPLKTDCVR
jgi:N-acyl-D-amino-acid deacylase